ncbi:DUF2510 domain-containing protein [Mycobacterium kansasii]|uniref:DUF2510 domain-containing protein n=1 Tax=Mycobacterium kansasii TaxID=1768 RepID=A0A653EXD2_MYCKA|nr:DUF2510 domain-containing protein [Mycobacterium kansasii]POX73208.1 DUF2510 domain-containing protein [Mycobacterium kansasii]POX79242.1 DUF2510 domain-containing protein [Mycobacterium kansasii]POX84206.1 DUF2510 domain-containing protein [Mycobacterium kansasii]POX84550.1 DUF2510 domain-containing protein [Mycobacterium kansasii]
MTSGERSRPHFQAADPSSARPPGWYSDPGGGPGARWWDGSRWAPQSSADTSEEWHGTNDREDPRSSARSEPQASPSPRGVSEPPSDLPRDGQTVRVRGLARAVQQRSTGSRAPVEVLQFRVERYDDSGNRLPRLQVEMRGTALLGSGISGQLSDNDEVEVEGVWKSGVLHTQSVLNHSTGAHLRSRSDWDDLRHSLLGKTGKKIRKTVWIAIIAIICAVAALISAIAVFVSHMNSSFNDTKNENLRNWCMNARDNGMRLPHECDGVL